MRLSIKNLELLDQMLVASKNYSHLISKEIGVVLVSCTGFEPITSSLKVNYKIKIKLFLNQENLIVVADRGELESPTPKSVASCSIQLS